MSSIPVFADAHSRLHADIAITRLVRAGIRTARISAIFPSRRAPNSVCCWLKNFKHIASSDLPIAAAGALSQLFNRRSTSSGVERDLEALGLEPEMADRLLEKVRDGQIVLCVHARNETEAAIAWHIFQHVGAENISSPSHELAAYVTGEIPAMVPQWNGAVIAA